jgi:F0F1-type ATP synthase delta subunit
MEKGTQTLSLKLLQRLHTTRALKEVADALEALTQNKAFKNHATSIVSDPTLTANQKKTQLGFVMQTVELPVLYDFFLDEIGEKQFWIFNAGKIDYFDKFVQAFQAAIESVAIVNVLTAIPLNQSDMAKSAAFFSAILGKQAVINHDVNPMILGGAIVKIENFVFDYSLRFKFRTFEAQWLSSLDKTTDIVRYESVSV